MAINRTILVKLEQKTEDNPVVQEFVTEILRFENEAQGIYSSAYENLIEKYYDKDADYED